MKIKKIICLLLTTAALIFTGCNDLFGKKNKYAEVIVTVDTGYIMKSRSASVTVPQYSFSVTATKGEETVGPVTDSLEGNENEFQLLLTPGTWHIEAAAVKTEEQNQIVLKGSNDVTVASNGKYDVVVPVTYMSEGNGSISLSINVESVVNKVAFSLEGQTIESLPATGNSVNITVSNVPSGNYDVILKFFGGSSNDVFLCSIPETINVRANLVTDKWIETGAGTYIKTNQSTGNVEFTLTDEAVRKIVDHEYYVDSNTENGSNQNTGTLQKPLETLEEAVKRINCLGDSWQTPYTVNVLNDLSISSASGLDLDNVNVILNADSEYMISGNIIAGQNAKLTLTNKILAEKITLDEHSYVWLKQIAGTGNGSDPMISEVIHPAPVQGTVVLKTEDETGIPQVLADRFLINAGYYIETDSQNNRQALIKNNCIQVFMPEINALHNEDAIYSLPENAVYKLAVRQYINGVAENVGIEALTNSNGIFQPELTPGEWKITGTVLKSEGSSFAQKILDGDEKLIVSANGKYSAELHTELLSAVTGATGKINLTMQLNPVVTKVKFKIDNAPYEINVQNNEAVLNNITLYETSNALNNIEFALYGTVSTEDVYLYTLPAYKIPIKSNLVTDKWIYKEGTENFIDSEGHFILSKDTLIELIGYDFYVSNSGNVENSGISSDKPTTLENAVERIKCLDNYNDENAYTIHVLDNITLDEHIELGNTNIILTADNPYSINGSVITVETNSQLTISNSILLGYVYLYEGKTLGLKNITSSEGVIAFIDSEPFAENLTVLKTIDNSIISEDLAKRFHTLPGYYIDPSESNPKEAVIKSSGITISINGAAESYKITLDGEFASTNNIKQIQQEETITVSSITNFGGTKSYTPSSIELWLQETKVKESATELQITSELLPGYYILKVKFEDNGLEIYGTIIIEVIQ